LLLKSNYFDFVIPCAGGSHSILVLYFSDHKAVFLNPESAEGSG